MTTPSVCTWVPHLEHAGFLKREGGDDYRRNGTVFSGADGWPFLRSSKPVAGADPLRGYLGRPGPWKLARLPGRPGRYLAFDLPPLPANIDDDADFAESAPSLPAASLAWAEATYHGRLPDDWVAPARAEVEALLPAGGLIVGVGPVARQVELVCRPDRLALRVPLLPRIPDGLGTARRAWLEANLRDGQDRWRLVRLGLADDPASAWAEVDLSGCPAGLVDVLLPSGLEALRWVSAWLLLPLAFLADPAVGSRAVEACLSADMLREKEDE